MPDKTTDTTAMPEKPVAKKTPAADKPASKAPAAKKAVADKPTAKKPAAKKTPAPKKTSEEAQASVEIFPEDDSDIVTLYDDENVPVEFFEVACVSLDEEYYALLQPVEPLDGVAEDEVVIFKLEEEDEENDLFIPVEDNDILTRVFDEYMRAVADEESQKQ